VQVHGIAGRDADARTALSTLTALRERQFVPAFYRALVHIGLGALDASLDMTLGRATTNDIVLYDISASRCHARLDKTPQGWEVVDLGSANGLRVNDARVGRATLIEGDVVAIGDSELRLVTGEDDRDPGMTRIDTMADLEPPRWNSPPSDACDLSSGPAYGRSSSRATSSTTALAMAS
jgi:hypothetical protein